MRLRLFIYAQLLLYAGLVVSCVTDYQPDEVSIPPALVVEGLISNQPGPYTVKLTRTADYSYKALNLLETGATVIISDNLGNQETLTEQASGGIYQTSVEGIQGVVGRTYKVTIKTRAGVQYESNPEVLKAAPAIDRIYYEYRYDAQASTNGLANGWDVYVDSKDPETLGDFYRWDWTHYEFTTVCQKIEVPGNPGYYSGIPCCTNCWDITRCYINCINVMSDASINGNTISRRFIERVPYDASTPYYLEVTQQSLSQGVYQFFKTADQQVANTGGLFDAAPGSIGGNIHSTTDSTLRAYGYFGAVGESVGYVLVDRSDAVGSPTAPDPVVFSPLAACVVCENSQYRTPYKPRWWSP